MNSKTFIITSVTAIFLVSFAALSNSVFAQTYEITGNSGNSNLQITQNSTTTVNQQSSANVINNVNSNANTGGNSINGSVGDGSIVTGDATSNVNINNNFNNNNAVVGCATCKNPTPTTKPGSPTPTPGPQKGGGDNNPPGGGGGEPCTQNCGGGSGGGSGSVLGLAGTSGDNGFSDLIKLLPALTFLGIGHRLLRKHA